MDHRAHGKSEGDYVGFGILDRFDMKAWIDCMEKRFEGNAEIVLYGVSMGATIAEVLQLPELRQEWNNP